MRKILIAGLGSIGQRHVRNLRTMFGDEVELLAYRARGLRHVITPQMTIDGDGDVETRYGIRAFADLDAALAERPDAVFVTNPNSLHMPVALAAARAGCHLFIEKPVSHNLTCVAELADCVERRGLVCLVGYQLRFHPCFTQAQCWLANGAIGAILSASLDFGEYLPDWHPYEDYRRMPSVNPDLGGDLVLAQIHDLDYAFALFGLPRRVFASGGRVGGLEISGEDTVSVLMDCLVGERPVRVVLHQDCVRRAPRRTCDITGERGRIVLDFNAWTVELFDASGRRSQANAFEGGHRNQLFLDELAHFVACMRGDESPVVGVRESVQSLRMALAVRESMTRGTPVELT